MDFPTFEKIWNEAIEPEAKKITDENTEILIFNQNSKLAIFNRYNELNKICKKNFMFHSDGLLDRHKVSAALVIAIVQTQPLISTLITDAYGDYYAFNETLAFRVALSLITNYVNKDPNAEQKINKFTLPIIQNADANRKETYQDVFCKMIRLDSAYNQISVLSLANILFLLESYSLLFDISEEHTQPNKSSSENDSIT